MDVHPPQNGEFAVATCRELCHFLFSPRETRNLPEGTTSQWKGLLVCLQFVPALLRTRDLSRVVEVSLLGDPRLGSLSIAVSLWKPLPSPLS